ncbi:MAG TPA: decarboxylating 6-phosphogluconate dehydrogenase [Actinomycetota bacterium]
MQLGMVGLGRMGANLSRRLIAAGHEIVGYDVQPESVTAIEAEGVTGASSIEELVGKLSRPRACWVMVPSAYAVSTTDRVAELMEAGDVVIDGGNTYYREDLDRAERYGARGVHFVDVGVSGGVFGLQRGFCLMIGGEDDVVRRLDPIFAALAPGVDAAPRTKERETSEPSTAEAGYLHCGPAGAGHFVKMVHNGIEYALMASYAEGLNLLAHANDGALDRPADAETAPLAEPRFYRYDLNVADVAEVWRRGSVISSWLLDLTAAALVEDPSLERFGGRVADSGEGRWTVQAAVDVGVPAPALAAALFDRFSSRDRDELANKVLSAMRNRFGGHVEL